MFCDLVGSTALSARLDPEDLRQVIGAYHACAAEVVARYEGFVAQYLGDGVLAYFGYPQAHEDDAERAVRAALALVEAVGQLGVASEKLQVRVGIATGLVVVGELIGSGEAKERGAVGETPNLAARLQALAKPNAVVVASSTRRLLGNLFDCQDLGTVEVKGFSGPVSACQVLRPSAVESRFEALHPEQTPLVGREEEIELLLRRWRQAKEREGQVVMLSGEPGIGKSRISAALFERLSNEPHIRLRYFCSPHAANSPLHPFASQLERAAGFAPEDSPQTKLDKLEALLTASSKDLAEDVPVVAEMLSIPIEGRYPPLKLAPQKKKERTLAALLAQLEGLAAGESVLTVFEDAHWVDPTSMELLERIVERVESLPILLVITFRPEFEPPWVGLAHVTLHPLNRLSRREAAAMIERLTRGKPLPQEVVDQIVARTDGVLLFVEELTKTVLESGWLQERGGQYVLDRPLRPLAIPTSLHASLMARLDRIAAPAKEIAQVGAALGRDFSYELLHAVVPWEDRALLEACDELSKATRSAFASRVIGSSCRSRFHVERASRVGTDASEAARHFAGGSAPRSGSARQAEGSGARWPTCWRSRPRTTSSSRRRPMFRSPPSRPCPTMSWTGFGRSDRRSGSGPTPKCLSWAEWSSPWPCTRWPLRSPRALDGSATSTGMRPL
jgi:class 3 adenylate cyclase